MKFPINLCQPDGRKSCGACCGIYNFKNNSKSHLSHRLCRNTRSLQSRSSSFESVVLFHSAKYRAEDNGQAKLFQTIFNCEYVGFLDENRLRVGCLLHPSLHRGRDYRDFSFYGAELCAGHFCLSYYYLTAEEQRLVIDTVHDWYLYGLTITDIDLVKGVFRVLSDRVGEAIDPEKVGSREVLSSIVSTFFKLKLDWPYRPNDGNRFGKYVFRGDEYRQVSVPYEKFGLKRSFFDSIFVAYGSEFSSSDEIMKAERKMEELVEAFARKYRQV